MSAEQYNVILYFGGRKEGSEFSKMAKVFSLALSLDGMAPT